MNRAAKLDGKRRNTVGFALTVLQRRLASSPEAIYRSLERRAGRLERRKQEVLSGGVLADPVAADVVGDAEEFDEDEISAEELEQIEDELVDAATAARTVEELDVELLELRDLIEVAGRVRASGTDRKWSELRTILEDNTLARSGTAGERRKLIAEPRSIYLLHGPARTEWQHSIPGVENLRYSITFRNILDGVGPA